MKTRTKKLIDSIATAMVLVARPLRSRKVRTGIATVIAAYAAEAGLEADTATIVTILGVGVSVILGTALEDFGIKRRSSVLDHYPKKTTAPDGREINRGAQT